MATSKDNRSGKVAERQALELPLNDQCQGNVVESGDAVVLKDKATGVEYEVYVKHGKLSMAESEG